MAFGVTQNPPGAEACVYLVGSYRATWKAPVQEQSSEQRLTPAAFYAYYPHGDFHQGLWWRHSRRPGDQQFLPRLLFCLGDLRAIQTHPASERTEFPSLANIR